MGDEKKTVITPKHAIGITVNGREVRAAFLTLVRGKARIKALESTKLSEPLEHAEPMQAMKAVESLQDLENAFDISESAPVEGDEVTMESELSTEKSAENPNVSLIYSLVDRFQHVKANVAINAPVLTVKYDYLADNVLSQNKDLKKKIKEKIDIWGNEYDEPRGSNYLTIADDKILQIDYEYHPPIIDLIEEVNQFRSGNMNLVLMDTNELALVDLVKEIYKFKDDEITAIIYIEDDFSRVIFLKGKEIYHITPIIHKGSMSKDVLEVIYSKMIFAQDQHFIPEINKILVAGHSSRLKAKYYFRQKFPYAITGYLNSKKIESDLRFKDRGLLFSRYAVPIALAWKALQKPIYGSRDKNFLPEYIVESKRLPKLTLPGYLLLFLIAISAFSFTWLIAKRNTEIRKASQDIRTLQTQIDNNKALTNRVSSFDNEIGDLEKKFELVEKYGDDYEETVDFLTKLNTGIERTGDIWITQFNKTGKKVNISGISRRREKIPRLTELLGSANLKKVTRSTYQGEEVYAFLLEKEINEDKGEKALSFISELLGDKEGNKATNGTAKK